MLRIVITLLLVILLLVGTYFAINFYKGFKASQQAVPTLTADTTQVADASQTADTTDTVAVKKEKPQTAEQQQAELSQAQQDSIYNKDPRVRYGAYHIIGLDTVIVAKKDQTFKSIARYYFGDTMECYIEVFNPDITTLKPGDKVKIPKIELKSHLKKRKK